LSKRNALLGSSYNTSSNNSQTNLHDGIYGGSRSPSPFVRPGSAMSNGGGGFSNARTAEDLESQNEEELEGLGAKVKMLKDISISIGNEVRDSTKFLNGMNDSFSETQGFLGGTFRRMNAMASRQGGRWWYWMLFLFLVFWIFVIRWLGII